MKLIKLRPLYRIFGVIWLICILGFIFLISYSTNWFSSTVDSTDFGKSIYFNSLFILFILVGFLSFTFGIFSLIYNTYKKGVSQISDKDITPKKGFRGALSRLIRFFIFVALFPLIMAFRIFNPLSMLKEVKKTGFKSLIEKFSWKNLIVKSLSYLFMTGIALPIWIIGYLIFGMLTYQATIQTLGYYKDPIPLSGTGSMYPTFPKGQGKTIEEQTKEVVDTPGMLPYPNGIVIFGNRVFNHDIERGDIISFFNSKTAEITKRDTGNETGFTKRVVALPGDSTEIKEGLFYLNDKPLLEPYIAKARSTFGGTYLSECKKFIIPEGKLFVMGDNRKGSLDSRHELELISYDDINHVIPYKNQKGVLDKNWRDTSNDLSDSSKIKFDKEKYLELLNQKRKESNVKLLKYQPKLEDSAKRRAEIMLQYNDFSYEAKSSGYTIEKAMRDADYTNIVWGEAPSLGHYETEELLENQYEFPDSLKFVLDKNFDEVGIAVFEGSLNGCPAQVIVQHFAGYVPPNYSSEMISSWETPLNQLKSVLPSWENIKNFPSTYNSNKQDADRLLEIMRLRISRMEIIVSKMRAQKWLTKEENNWTYEDEGLFNEQETIAKRLSSQTWK